MQFNRNNVINVGEYINGIRRFTDNFVEMAVDKKNEFGKRKQMLAKYAKAIAHPARIAILRKLAQDPSCNCNQIVQELPLAQSTVSQHLKELKKAGLIEGVIDGPRSCYRLNKEAMHEFEHEVARLFNNIRHKK